MTKDVPPEAHYSTQMTWGKDIHPIPQYTARKGLAATVAFQKSSLGLQKELWLKPCLCH